MMKPAIGFLETNSIAKGIEASDGMCKMAGIELVDAYPICPGKYVILITGLLADVQSAMQRGKEIAGETVVDEIIIPNLHPQVIPSILGTNKIELFEAVGSIETFTIASCILAADAAVKAAKVSLIELRLGKGIGGRSYVTMCGEVSAVRSAVNSGCEVIKEQGVLIQSIVIPQAHPELRRTLL